MTATDYQKAILPLIKSKLGNLEIEKEWIAFQGHPYHYSPRIDIAIGPFSKKPGCVYIDEYDSILKQIPVKTFLLKTYDYHFKNIRKYWTQEKSIPNFDDIMNFNKNARCLIAFEIENTSTKKHIMGSMINAASLGRVGIGVAFNDTVLRTFIRITNYMGFLKDSNKNTYEATNLLFVTKEQLLRILNG